MADPLVPVTVTLCRPCLAGDSPCVTDGCVLHGVRPLTDEQASAAVGRAVFRQGDPIIDEEAHDGE